MVKVVAIVGPTAVGKTALSIQLAQRLNGEIISGDSMQVYRHLNIGTAKVTPTEMAGIPHYLIDIKDVTERFSVAEFKDLAQIKINEISQRQHLPIIVGGTGFYLKALMENLTLGDDHFDDQSMIIRQRWQARLQSEGSEAIWQALKRVDPQAAQQIPVQNSRRVIRALEVVERTGNLFSAQKPKQAKDEFLVIGLTTERSILYERINHRVDLMMEAGLLDEVKWLQEQGGSELPAAKGIGYREYFSYLAGDDDLASAVERVKLDSRHYAKRQLTWFRNQVATNWYDLVSGENSTNEIEESIVAWLKK